MTDYDTHSMDRSSQALEDLNRTMISNAHNEKFNNGMSKYFENSNAIHQAKYIKNNNTTGEIVAAVIYIGIVGLAVAGVTYLIRR